MSEPEVRRRRGPSASLVFACFAVSILLVVAGVIVGEARALIRVERPDPDVNLVIASAIYLMGLGAVLALEVLRHRRQRPDRVATPLCVHCFNDYVEGAHFCPTCGHPNTWFAGTGPYEQIHARAWCIGKAAHHPSRPAHVWLLTLAGLVGGGQAVFVLVQSLVEPTLAGQLAVPVAALGGFISLRLGWLALHNWRTRPRDPDGPPVEGSTYGTPPWWTYDAHWRRGEPGDAPAPSGDVTPIDGTGDPGPGIEDGADDHEPRAGDRGGQ
jgi:hypothetical protein